MWCNLQVYSNAKRWNPLELRRGKVTLRIGSCLWYLWRSHGDRARRRPSLVRSLYLVHRDKSAHIASADCTSSTQSWREGGPLTVNSSWWRQSVNMVTMTRSVVERSWGRLNGWINESNQSTTSIRSPQMTFMIQKLAQKFPAKSNSRLKIWGRFLF